MSRRIRCILLSLLVAASVSAQVAPKPSARLVPESPAAASVAAAKPADQYTLAYFNPATDQAKLFGTSGGGFLFGTNEYGDIAKMVSFTLPGGLQSARVTSIDIWFGYRKAGLSNFRYGVALSRVAPDGSPDINDQATDLLYEEYYDISHVVGDADPATPVQVTRHPVAQATTVPNQFFVIWGVDPGYTDVNALGILSSDYQGHRVPEVWEVGGNQDAVNLSDAWTGGTDGWYPWISVTVETSAGLQMVVNQVDASNFPTIDTYVSVTDDQGNPISGLTAANFSTLEGTAAMQGCSVTSVGQTTSGVSVTLVIDRSGSMSGTPIDAAKQAAIDFVNQMGTNDFAGIVSFASSVTVDHAMSNDKASLIAAINAISATGGTAMYDGVIAGVDQVRVRTGRKAVILLADGDNNEGAERSLDNLVATIKPHGVPVYTIGLGSITAAPLERIASETGGVYYAAPTPQQLATIYAQIGVQLANQYRIRCTTPNPAYDGTVRTVNVTVSNGTGSATGSGTYTAPGGSGLVVTVNQVDASNFPTIDTYVSVTDDQGNPITGLTGSNFTVNEDGVPMQQCTVTTVGQTSSAITVSLVIDRSGSMSGSAIAAAKQAAIDFVNQMGVNDRAGVVSFASDVRTDHALSGDKASLVAAIQAISASGNTAMHDGVIAGVNQVRNVAGRKAVILLADGDSNTGTVTSLDTAINEIKPAGVPVYTIGLGSVTAAPLERIANETGGVFFQAPTPQDLASIYARIGLQLANQYLIRCTTPNTARDGTLRTVNVSVDIGTAQGANSGTYTAPGLSGLNVTVTQVDASNFPTIDTYVSVTDAAGNPVTGLTGSNFVATEDGANMLQCTVTSIGQTASAVSVTLVIDRSGSMSGSPIAAAKQAAVDFINQMGTGDMAGVVSFADDVRFDHALSSDKASLIAAINAIAAGGWTAMHDGVIAGVNQVRLRPGRKAVILLADGDNNTGSVMSLDETINQIVPAGVPVYTIGLGSVTAAPLERIANETGGRFFQAPTPQDLASIYSLIGVQLANQYLVRCTTPKPATDGTVRTVTITVTSGTDQGADSGTYTAPGSVTAPIPIWPYADTPRAPGVTFPLTVSVGKTQSPVTNLFGVSYVLNYNAQYLTVGNVSLQGGLGSDLVSYFDTATPGRVAIGVSRKAGQGGVSGTIPTAVVTFTISGTAPSGTQLLFTVDQVLALDPTGATITLTPLDWTVVVSSTKQVWPGDTNDDTVVNQADVLPLGLHWGRTGPARPGASLQWLGQALTAWSPVNAAFADATGDGAVNQADVLPIGLNWGMTHAPKDHVATYTAPSSASPEANELVVRRRESRVNTGDEFWVDVVATDVSNLFGIAFELVASPAANVTLVSAEAGAWMGSDLIFFPNLSSATGVASIGVSRKAGQGTVSGTGVVASVKARMNAAAGTTTTFSLRSVTANDDQGSAILLAPRAFAITTAVEGDVPLEFALDAAYPNPFNPTTVLAFTLDVPGDVRLQVFDAAGRLVAEPLSAHRAAGRHEIVFDATTLSSGLYIVRLAAGDRTATRTIVLAK